MFKVLKDFVLFCKKAKYSVQMIITLWIGGSTLFSAGGLLLQKADPVWTTVFYSVLAVLVLVNYIVAFIVYKYLLSIRYFSMIADYTNWDRRPDICFDNWWEILGIVLRKTKSLKTLKGPSVIDAYDFFNIKNLTFADQYKKLQAYKRYVQEKIWIYPWTQQYVLRIQMQIAERLIQDEQIRQWKAQYERQRANTNASDHNSAYSGQEYWRAILGIAADASFADAKKAYRKLAMKHHPDRGGKKEQFQQLQTAWKAAEVYYQ